MIVRIDKYLADVRALVLAYELTCTDMRSDGRRLRGIGDVQRRAQRTIAIFMRFTSKAVPMNPNTISQGALPRACAALLQILQ